MATLYFVTAYQTQSILNLPGQPVDTVNDAKLIASAIADGTILASAANGAVAAAAAQCQLLHLKRGASIALMQSLMLGAISEQGSNLPKGTALGDVASSPDLTAGKRFVLPAATLSAGRIYTLAPVGNAALAAGLFPIFAGTRREFTRLDAGAFAMTLLNGGPAAGNVFVGIASKANFCVVEWNGTDWEFVSGGAQ